jgi:hypothetical protein
MQSQFMEITQEWLKDGGKGGTEIEKSMQCSDESMKSFVLYPDISQSVQLMCPASTTQQTNHQEEYTHPKDFYSLQSIFLMPLEALLSTQQNLPQLPNSIFCATGVTPLQQPKSSIEPSFVNKVQNIIKPLENKKTKSSSTPSATPQTLTSERRHFEYTLPINATTPANPQPYRPNLTPAPSQLCPHCLARDRLRLWIPAGESPCRTSEITGTNNTQNSLSISDTQLDRILEVMGSLWALSMKETYGAGLLVFHVYCGSFQISEEHRCPISHALLLAFLLSCTGSYSGSVLSNYVAGLKAWHLLHGRPWLILANELKLSLAEQQQLPHHHPNEKNAVLSPQPLSFISRST